jgi:hypothetical protein
MELSWDKMKTPEEAIIIHHLYIMQVIIPAKKFEP